ncbi:MAG: hypothetical protein ACRD5Z_16495, partial [Bryobacteraceae bacterium]
MPKAKRSRVPDQAELIDVTAKLRTAPCVPALREAVKAWKAGGYKGITDTTRILFNHWFYTDHRTRAGATFKYHASQQEAIETLVFVWEFEKVRTRKGLLERYAQNLRDLRLPPYDDFARYCRAKANILPEQAIGRGLRLMFRDLPNDYRERVDIIGNKAFLDFVDDLEKLEELKLDTFEIGKDKLHIVTILPLENRKEFDIGLPVLTPSLVRKKSLAEEITALEVMGFQSIVLPKSEDDPRAKTFKYEGFDIITLKKEFEREYTIPEPQTAQEVIGYYARRIAEAVKLPAQFAALAPKVREFFEHKAFGHSVDLTDPAIVKAMSTPVAHYVCVDIFKKALQALTIEEQTPQLLEPTRLLSSCQPFPWSRPVLEGAKCIL